MPATKVGIVTKTRRDGRAYRALRWQVGGERHYKSLGPVSEGEAEREAAHLRADIERGLWAPDAPADGVTGRTTFSEFALGVCPEDAWRAVARLPDGEVAGWWANNVDGWRPKTVQDYKWRLGHLVPFFGGMPLDTINFSAVERFKASKLKEPSATGRPLTPRAINMLLTLLGQILERARKHGLVTENPARDPDLHVKEREPARSYLESADQIEALLDAAAELDQRARGGQGEHVERRASLAVLTFAGLRISELLALRWKDVDLAGGRLTVGDAKTDAGRRKVKIRGALRDELAAVRGRRQGAPQTAFVFPTATGGRMRAENYRKRVLKPAVALADKRRAGVDLPPLPEKLTPHSLRRTFCSLLYALGEDPGTVMDEMGHTDPGLALRVYRQAMRRSDEEKAALAAVVEGRVAPVWHPDGLSSAPASTAEAA